MQGKLISRISFRVCESAAKLHLCAAIPKRMDTGEEYQSLRFSHLQVV